MTKLKHLLALVGLILPIATLTLSVTPPTSASSENLVVNEDSPRIVLWNEDHCQITDLIGEWRVRSAAKGSRMRPQHDECYIKILSSVDGIERQYRVRANGEVYIAHGWIAVNQMHQETWSAQAGGAPSPGVGDTDVSDCAVSYTKEQVVSVSFDQGACWRSQAEPGGGCEFVMQCLQGTGGCHVEIGLVDHFIDSIEGECGSGSTLKQCVSASGSTHLCYRN